MKVGIVDTGVNAWHSHVRGNVAGCRVYVGADGTLQEDGDFRDAVGHGTAVAGVIREAFPDAEIYAVRVFDGRESTYPSLVARGVLRAAAAGCEFINVSVSVPPSRGADLLSAACAVAIDAGCVIVASARPDRPGWLPASVPRVYAVTADDALALSDVRRIGSTQLAAPGRPRDLDHVASHGNLRGPSFACARALVHLARLAQRERATSGPG